MKTTTKIMQCCALAVLLVGLIAPSAMAFCQRMYIPSYFYPGALWDQADAKAPVVDVMIMNPASGPGTSQDSNYVTAVQNARNAGVKVLGYVHTSYSQRNIDTVKGEVDSYLNWYNISGIFFDEANTSAAGIAYYQNVSDYVYATAAPYVSLNPGTIPNPGYMNISDNVVIFEGTYATYKSWASPSWASSFPSSKITHLVHATSTTSRMNDAVTKAKARNAGYVYVTNDVLPNPWDTLPSYFNSEITKINQSSTC